MKQKNKNKKIESDKLINYINMLIIFEWYNDRYQIGKLEGTRIPTYVKENDTYLYEDVFMEMDEDELNELREMHESL
jgi:hypothetical protein